MEEATVTTESVPQAGAAPDLPLVPHLLLLWAADSPERCGEVASLTQACLLGRGVGDGSDMLARLQLSRQRPGRMEPALALTDPRLSRSQLEFVPVGNGQVDVRNVGQRPLSLNGVRINTARVQAGDVLVVEGCAAFLIEQRPQLLKPTEYFKHVDLVPFGGPDAAGFVGESPAAWALRDQLSAAAASRAHVLIHGRSGVGKELAARSIHLLSNQRRGPLISRNASTIPHGLIDAELFGNVKDYPNAGSPERKGLIGAANGSTLLLDEVGELPPEQQAHLLRTLDAGEYQRLGESGARHSAFRTVGVTNRALSVLKPDFLARFPWRVRVPDISQRRADIGLLIRVAWQRVSADEPELTTRFPPANETSQFPRIAPELVGLLARHTFVSNFRELERLFRIAIFHSSRDQVRITPELEDELKPAKEDASARTFDKESLLRTLEMADGNVTQAAALLGLKNRFALYRLLTKHGVERPRG